MNHHDLPERWKTKLGIHLSENLKTDRVKLSAEDFRYGVKIVFPDRSFAFFNYAFYLADREMGEVAVFTEHCGYHIFPLEETEVELMETKLAEDE